MPSATDRAFQLLKATEAHRCVFQRPTKWVDDHTLMVRASGDVENPARDGAPVWYQADIRYDILKKKISEARMVETNPKEG